MTAENITVVTAAEIAALNAHTLADVLDTVTGVQLQMLRTPGTVSGFQLQGSKWSHVLVLLDNVPINNLTDNMADISSIPAQIIERVEVVKGAASSSWGSALGGVVNVITKPPAADRPFAGELSSSLGKSSTYDNRGELSGTVNRLGYYLSAGKLHSDGLLPHNQVDLQSYYAKIQYDLNNRGVVTFSGLYTHNDSGQGTFYVPPATPKPGYSATIDQTIRQMVGTLQAQYHVSDRLSLEGALKLRDTHTEVQNDLLLDSGDRSLVDNPSPDSSVGGSLGMRWRGDWQRLALGVDYDHIEARATPMTQTARGPVDRSADRVGIYLNDLLTVGRLALIPSVRFDHTGTNGDQFSPNLGVTYSFSENSVIRGYTGRGYSLTSLTSDSTEKVWTSQLGFETGEIPFLWTKGTVFRNDTWNISTQDRQARPSQKKRQLKQGAELEIRSLPLFRTALYLGYTFIHAEDADTDQIVHEVPRHTLKVGAVYEDPRILKAVLTGSYIDWNAAAEQKSRSDIIWDLHLGKKIAQSDGVEIEFFLSLRNLLNGKQYLSEYYKNTGRWAEAGFRCRF